MAQQVRSVGIAGTGFYVPDIVVTNEDLAAQLPTSDAWIREHIGIIERRIAPADVQTSDLAVRAALPALEAAKVKVEDVDAIMIAIGTGDAFSPPTANVVQTKLGCKRAFCVDVRQACCASVSTLVMASQFVAAGTYDNVLVIGAELASRTKIAPDDRTGRAIFGDGAGAVVLKAAPQGYGILSSYLRSDGSGWDAVGVYAGGSVAPLTPERVANNEHCIRMDGRRVWEFVTMAFPDSVREAVARADLKLDDIDIVIPHQANLHGIHAGMQALGLPIEMAYTVIERYGNTIEASVLIALAEAVERGRIKRDDIVVMAAFGAGWNWGSLALRWQ